MSKDYSPVPTEYQGVKYRSKSEAVFAFHLDKAGWLFQYENDAGSVIHPWDFILYGMYRSPEFFHEVRLIEYKPGKPTQQYIENLNKKIRSHFQSRIDSLINARSDISINEIVWKPGFDIELSPVSQLILDLQTRFSIVYGSPWNSQEEKVGSVYAEIEIFPVIRKRYSERFDFPYEITKEALNYRFDLQQ